MSAFLLTPQSVVSLCLLVLASALTAYLFSVRNKSKATWWLAASMSGHVVFLAMLLLLTTAEGESARYLSVFQLVALLCALTAGIGFAYHFVELLHQREWKWAVGVSSFITAAWGVALTALVSGWIDASTTPVDMAIAVTVGTMTVWTFVVYLRKSALFARRNGFGGGFSRVLFGTIGRSARAHRAFGYLTVLLFAVAVLVGLDSAGVIPTELGNSMVMVGFLAYFYSVAVIYVNHATEPTTFQVKIISFALATVVAVLGLTTLVVFDTVDLVRASGVPLPRTALTFERVTDDRYEVHSSEEPLLQELGDTLDIDNGGSVAIPVGFQFAFGGSQWDSVFVDDDGFLSFGADYSLLDEFDTAESPIIAPYFTALHPEQSGYVIVGREPERLTVTWDSVAGSIAFEPVTAQVSLYSSGAIVFRYGYISPTAVEAQRGVFPSGRTDGEIEVAPDGDFPATVAAGAAVRQDYEKAFEEFVHGRVVDMAWLILGATLFVLVVFPFLLRSSITRPLGRLLDGVRRVNEGDLDAKVPVTIRDELGNLALNFNRMTASLQSAEEQLRAHADELEQRVLDRTMELQSSLEELRSMQAQLIQQEKMASLGALTAGIAHEIKNPLNFVNNFASLSVELAEEMEEELERIGPNLGEETREIRGILEDLKLNAAKIAEHGKRADGIVKSMLQHSRGKSGERADADLNELLGEYVNLAYHGMRAQDPQFNCRIERELDPSVGKINVVHQDLGRVFINLLNNAFYAVSEKSRTSGPGYEPAVTVRTESRDDTVMIEIQDNGPGIPDSLKHKIFEPFYTTKPTGSGTGLGLSLSYDIVTQEHGGEMDVHSIPGRETTFTIRLPVRQNGRDTSTQSQQET